MESNITTPQEPVDIDSGEVNSDWIKAAAKVDVATFEQTIRDQYAKGNPFAAFMYKATRGLSPLRKAHLLELLYEAFQDISKAIATSQEVK